MVLKGLILSLCLLTASIHCSGQHIQIVNGDTLHLITSAQMRQILLDKADNELYLEQLNNMRLENTYYKGIINSLNRNIRTLHESVLYERNLNKESADAINYLEKELKRADRREKTLKLTSTTGLAILVVLLILK